MLDLPARYCLPPQLEEDAACFALASLSKQSTTRWLPSFCVWLPAASCSRPHWCMADSSRPHQSQCVVQAEFAAMLKDYVGRESPLYHADRLSEHYRRSAAPGSPPGVSSCLLAALWAYPTPSLRPPLSCGLCASCTGDCHRLATAGACRPHTSACGALLDLLRLCWLKAAHDAVLFCTGGAGKAGATGAQLVRLLSWMACWCPA